MYCDFLRPLMIKLMINNLPAELFQIELQLISFFVSLYVSGQCLLCQTVKLLHYCDNKMGFFKQEEHPW